MLTRLGPKINLVPWSFVFLIAIKEDTFVVRHNNTSKNLDWSQSDPHSGEMKIKWAAFYSDCEHEVLEVQSGYRITLTYNLYTSSGLGDMTGNAVAMDPKQLPLYSLVKELLSSATFMKDGT